MFKIVKVKNCYGINGDHIIRNIEFRKNVPKNKHVVFGVNLTGKTSLVKVLKSLKDNGRIDNVFNKDRNPEVEFVIGNNTYIYNNGWNQELQEHLYICDKNYLNNSIAILNNVAIIGIDMKGLERINKELEKIKVKSAESKEFIKQKFTLNSQKECTGYYKEIQLDKYFSTRDQHLLYIHAHYDLYNKNNHISLPADNEYLDLKEFFKRERVNLEIVDKHLQSLLDETKKLLINISLNLLVKQRFTKQYLNIWLALAMTSVQFA